MGTVIGIIGLIPIVVSSYNNHFTPGIKVLTNLFGVLVATPIVIWLLLVPCWIKESCMKASSALMLIWFGIFIAIYADWVLAGVARNWAGTPSSDVAVLFWLYFAAKRLPMLSI
jgi:hypothetical protein